MKEIFLKILALTLSALVLLSTFSFTVDMHYCGDKLVDMSIFEEAEACGMKSMPVATSCDANMEKTSCCSDIEIVLEGQDDLQDNMVKLTYEQQVFLIGYAYAYISLFESSGTSKIDFNAHSPPSLEKDLQVLYETFLI